MLRDPSFASQVSRKKEPNVPPPGAEQLNVSVRHSLVLHAMSLTSTLGERNQHFDALRFYNGQDAAPALKVKFQLCPQGKRSRLSMHTEQRLSAICFVAEHNFLQRRSSASSFSVILFSLFSGEMMP